MNTVLYVNGYDYSHYVKHRGIAWTRENINTSDSGRTLDGRMHIAVVAQKRTLSYELTRVPADILAQLDKDLSQTTFSVTYADLHGQQTRTFYCTSFSATLMDIVGGNDKWVDAKFKIIEV